MFGLFKKKIPHFDRRSDAKKYADPIYEKYIAEGNEIIYTTTISNRDGSFSVNNVRRNGASDPL